MAQGSDLASLTLKDLRQLAGEHQIKNRSKLSKQDLIDALTPILEQTGDRPAAAEPEVLDPAALAALTGGDDDDDQDGDDQDGDEDPSDGGQRDQQAQGEDGEPRKKRRRRRRRRGKKKNGDDAEGGEPGTGQSAEATPGEAPAKDQPKAREERQAQPKTDEPVRAKAEAEPKQRAARDEAKEAPANKEAPKNTDAAKGSDDRPPRPSLDSPAKRKLPAMLERMRAFTEGILELCDPDTPSWAQARLSELLAAAGVVPTPCSGRPHPDFHRVIGTVASTEVPAGHIAVIEAPGFSLRGDRGDLFPLRPAQVRVAGGRTSDRQDDRAGGEKPAPSERQAEREPAAVESGGDAADEAVVDDDAPAIDQIPTERDAAADRRDADDDQGDDRPRRDRDDRPRRERGDRPRRERDQDRQAADPSEGPVIDEPEPAAPPRSVKVVPAEEAPPLPLEPQEAEELAARPKAEGWRALGLNEQILADLHDVGYTEPSEIQAKAIGIVTAGKDLIGQSQTGSGKTAAFVLPLLHRLYEFEGQGPAALILCPTRELARQVHAEFVRMAGKSGARAALIYGGVGMDDQFKALARHPHVVIGTPGRVIDHARRRTLDLSRLQMCILDEADQMLDIGFLPDIEWVLRHSPPERQMLLFSATMPDAIRKLAEQHMHDPETIHVAPKQVTVENVDQKFIAVDRDKKTALLAHFIETYEPPQMVVFCNTKHQTDRVANVLKKKKMSAAAIHGDLPQAKREKVLQGFRDGKVTCLLATNVAARGLDIPSVSHVVNYDVPGNPEEYVHRVGRTARMGREGIARTFVTPEDGQFVLEIEKHIGVLLEEELVEGMQTSTAKKVERTIAGSQTTGPRLLKPIMGGIRLGRARR